MNVATVRLWIAGCLLAASSWACAADHRQFKIIYVDDGDTVIGMDAASKAKTEIRLASIDAPETDHTKKTAGRVGQPFSKKSKEHLAALVKGREVDAVCYEKDGHAREVCSLQVGTVDVSRSMVEAGLAWANLANHGRYLRDKALLDVEAQARARQVGLWAERQPVAPWVWRTQCWERKVCPDAESGESALKLVPKALWRALF